jgi:hypothetical protein
MTPHPDNYREGPPRYFAPVCVKGPLGFLGGPSGYEEVSDKDHEPIIIESKEREP